VRAAAASAAAAGGLGLVLGASAATPPITQADSGRTFRLHLGRSETLRLSSAWVWSPPRPGSRAVELTPIMYFRDPGFTAWNVRARAPGTATISSVGKPACSPCGLATRRFRVTVVVG
jgi:hypothetical protein